MHRRKILKSLAAGALLVSAASCGDESQKKVKNNKAPNINKGKGYSLIKSFKHAYNLGYTHAITIDADFQHPPSYIIDFLNIQLLYKITKS